MRCNPFIAFIRSERWRYAERDNNRLTFAASHASRYYDYLSLILACYSKADQACRDDYQRIDELCRAKPDGFPSSELEQSAQLRCELLLEIESFYTMAKTLLDRVANLVLLYFGPARRCRLRSHYDFLKCYDKYFKTHEIAPPKDIIVAMRQLQNDISDFRDKKITHQNNPRVSLGIAFPNDQGAYLNVGHFYPKPSDERYQSRPLDALIEQVDEYLRALLSFLTDNRDRTQLQPVERRSPTSGYQGQT